MSATRSRQQRLFTGSLFPEVLNAQLFAFATRHHLQSNVWVPQKAFETALKPYHIFILPHAALCDVSLTPGSSVADVIEAIGTDRILVNAQHTSHQKLMENFRDFMVSRLTIPPQLPASACAALLSGAGAGVVMGRQIDARTIAALQSSLGPQRTVETEYFSAADKMAEQELSDSAAAVAQAGFDRGDVHPVTLQPDPQWERLPPFCYPLALNSSPLLGTETSARLLRCQQENPNCSNYWRRVQRSGSKTQHFRNTGLSECPGRYNPFFCVHYVPHNLLGRSFPVDIARRMRHCAVAHGYVSRLWLSRRQGEELFGTRLLPEHADGAAPVYCNFHTGGVEAIGYFCADQFEQRDGVFPTRREVELAAQGVWTSPAKIVAFPLLRELQAQYSTETARGSSERTGVDVTMLDSRRHKRFCELAATYDTVQLIGTGRPAAKERYLAASGLLKLLRRMCILRGYPTASFISHRTVVKLGLRVRAGEEGVVQTRVPVGLHERNAFTSGECWFNIAQLEEPDVAAELLHHWPQHFFTRRLLQGRVCAQCCRAQARERATRVPATTSALPQTSGWVPLYVLDLTGWQLRPGACGVPYDSFTGIQGFRRFAVGHNVLFRLADVLIDNHLALWLQRYTPVDEAGRPYLRGLRQLLTLRAYERGYQSPVWVSFPVSTGSSQVPLLQKTMAAVRSGIRPFSDINFAFATPPLVQFRGLFFVNKEELVRAPTISLARAFSSTAAKGADAVADGEARLVEFDDEQQFRVNHGVGLSAEQHGRQSWRNSAPLRQPDNASSAVARLAEERDVDDGEQHDDAAVGGDEDDFVQMFSDVFEDEGDELLYEGEADIRQA